MSISVYSDLGKEQASNAWVGARAVKLLSDHYRGYTWRVKIDEDNGVVYIINSTINAELNSNMPYGVTLLLQRVLHDRKLKCILMAGGEILERANLQRGSNIGLLPTYIEGVKQKHQPINVSFD